MSEIQNFTDASISDIHTCVKVYTYCHYGAFVTNCTIIAKLCVYPPHKITGESS